MFKRLSASLGQAADRLHASEGLRRGQLLLSWVQAVGSALARQAAPAEIQGDTLHLVCSGPTWSQEILMRQREILARLNPLLGGTPLRRLRCRVGRFQPAPAPQAREEEAPIPWETVSLDPAARTRIDGLVAQIEDPEMADRVRRLLEQIERRRIVAFSTGAIACGSCGSPTRRSPCRTCRREARARRRQAILQRLGREPWLTRADLLSDFPDLRAEEFLQMRLGLRSRLEQDIWVGMRALPTGAPLPDALRARVIEVVMLTTGLPAHRLDDRHVRHSLGPTLARAYLENQACGPWTGNPGPSPRQEEVRPASDPRPTSRGSRRPRRSPAPRPPHPGAPT